jgi:hypothetical protein
VCLAFQLRSTLNPQWPRQLLGRGDLRSWYVAADTSAYALQALLGRAGLFRLNNYKTNFSSRSQTPANDLLQLAIILSAHRPAHQAQSAIACQRASYLSTTSSNMPPRFPLVKPEVRQAAALRQLPTDGRITHRLSQHELHSKTSLAEAQK